MTQIQFKNITIFISLGDLTFQETEALICPCFDSRNHDAGVCRQVKIRAGEDLMIALGRSSNSETSFQTNSFRLAMRRIRSIIHLYNQGFRQNYDTIALSLQSAFSIAVEKKIKVISLGSLNASNFKLSYKSISTLILDSIEKELSGEENTIEKIHVTDSNENFITQFTEVLNERIKK